MKFSKLASYFERLEKTSSRLILIDILSELFKETGALEIDKIVYLSQGRIAPFFEPVEMGMAEKTVIESIAAAYGSNKQVVSKRYGIVGDLGEVAEEMARRGSRPSGLQVTHVFDHLLEVFVQLEKIAKEGGEGTVQRRIDYLKILLTSVDPISAKHIVRIVLGNLRLGIGDPTILDGLALARLGDRNKRKELEEAYNRTSDLGLIAKTLWSGGLKAVESLKIQVGKPIRSELCERLPSPQKAIEKMEIVNVQYKYDGFRVQIHKNGNIVKMFSRNLESMTHMFPELIKATLEQVKADTAILDSEALAYNPESEEFLPFQETTKRRRKYGIEELSKTLPLKAFVFDLLYKDGKSYIDEPLTKRLEVLKDTIKEDGVLIATKDQTVSDAKTLSIILDDAISKGLEGVVIKKLDSKYVAGGRNFNWVKLKRATSGELQDTIDCVILGYIFGLGKRTAFGAGALLVGVYDSEKDEFVTVSKIGTGLTDEEWREIHKRADKIKVNNKPARINSVITPSVWIAPEIVIEILADEITRSPIHTAGKTEIEPGYALRFPRLVSFRGSDKRAEDATSVEELIEMYQQQGKKD